MWLGLISEAKQNRFWLKLREVPGHCWATGRNWKKIMANHFYNTFNKIAWCKSSEIESYMTFYLNGITRELKYVNSSSHIICNLVFHVWVASVYLKHLNIFYCSYVGIRHWILKKNSYICIYLYWRARGNWLEYSMQSCHEITIYNTVSIELILNWHIYLLYINYSSKC